MKVDIILGFLTPKLVLDVELPFVPAVDMVLKNIFERTDVRVETVVWDNNTQKFTIYCKKS